MATKSALRQRQETRKKKDCPKGHKKVPLTGKALVEWEDTKAYPKPPKYRCVPIGKPDPKKGPKEPGEPTA